MNRFHQKVERAESASNKLLDSIPLETPRFRQAKSDSSESLNESEIEDLSDASFMKGKDQNF